MVQFRIRLRFGLGLAMYCATSLIYVVHHYPVASTFIPNTNIRRVRNSYEFSLITLQNNLNHDEKETGDKDESAVFQYNNPITSLLGKLLPNEDKGNDGKSLNSTWNNWKANNRSNRSMEQLISVLDQALREREWFVTGNVMTEFFADEFEFQDPNVQLSGIENYAKGVRKLFNQDTSRAEVISVELNLNPERERAGTRVITVEWRLSGNVNIGPISKSSPGLYIKPYICYTDLYVRDSDGLIVFQEDRFDIPGWDIVLSALFPWLGPPVVSAPALSVEEILISRQVD